MTRIISAASIVAVAMACHAANAAYCRSLGDDSQADWVSAPEWQQASAIAGVEFHLDNPDASDAASHESWLKQKEADGWTYGETKDPEQKTHPCMVPFDQLPKEQQFKDALFRTIVWAMVPRLAELEQTDAVGDAMATIDKLTAELAVLQLQVDAAATAPAAARSKASGGRKVSAKDVKDGLEGAELLAAIGGAETVELVFSNGRTEIAGLEAVLISGNAWFIGQAGLQLRLPELLVHGPATGKPGFALGGYGLVLDGKLRAYAPRGDQLMIGAGATVNLAPDVVFA